jgi:hypothetical protein
MRAEMSEPSPCTSKSSPTVQSSDGRIVLDVENGRLISINRTGSQILTYLDQGWDELRIAAEISQQSGAPIQAVLSDTVAFVQSLKELRLFPRVPSPEKNQG